jgi:hypothetical protein
MDVQLRNKGIQKLLFDREIVLYMIMQYFKALECFRMKTDFIKQLLSDLVIFDHSKDTHLRDTLYKRLTSQIRVTTEGLNQVSSLLAHLHNFLFLYFVLSSESLFHGIFGFFFSELSCIKIR